LNKARAGGILREKGGCALKRLGVKTVVILASAVFICGLAVGLVGALSDRSLITAVGIVIMGIAVLMRKFLSFCPHCGASLARARSSACPFCGKNVYKS